MPNSALSNLSVLVVEDVHAMRAILRGLLRQFGITKVEEAVDGRGALAILATRHIDVVISDLCMEPMDGMEFVRRLRRPRSGLNAFVPVIMISAYAQPARVKEAVGAGVNQFLVKPVTAAALEQRLLTILRAPKRAITHKSYCGPDRRRGHVATRWRRRASETIPTYI